MDDYHELIDRISSQDMGINESQLKNITVESPKYVNFMDSLGNNNIPFKKNNSVILPKNMDKIAKSILMSPGTYVSYESIATENSSCNPSSLISVMNELSDSMFVKLYKSKTSVGKSYQYVISKQPCITDDHRKELESI